MKLTRKTLGVLLALVMVLALLPAVTVTARATAPTSGTTGKSAESMAINTTNNTTPTDLATPLTLQAITDGTILVKNPKDGMEYSINGGTKQAVTDEITVSAGNTVAFYGAADCYDGTTISGGTAQCYIYGNIMSLMDATNFASATALTKACAFYSFFEKNACLFSHPDRKLVLPATTLTNSCYEYMFYGCTGLTTAPELPATALAESCYRSMFRGCENLTTAPALPATTLVKWCYFSMFHGCTNLNAVTCLATDISVTNATSHWLKNVASTGTFTKASGTNWPTDSDSGIPVGWTVKDYTPTPTPTPTPAPVSHSEETPSASLTVTSEIGTITRVTVDGKEVDSKYYFVSGNSVVLSDAFMRSLSNGTHTIRLYDGETYATATWTVSGNTIASPKTADPGVVLYAALAVSATLGLGYMGKKRKED